MKYSILTFHHILLIWIHHAEKSYQQNIDVASRSYLITQIKVKDMQLQTCPAKLSNYKLLHCTVQNSSNNPEDQSAPSKRSALLGGIADTKTDLQHYQLQERGMGIISIKQNYKNLFYDPSTKLEFPIKELELKFYDYTKKRQIMRIVLGQKIVVLQVFQGKPDRKEVTTNKPLFPTQNNAPYMLQKRIWIRINKLINLVNISTGDIAGLEEEVFINQTLEGPSKNKLTWKTEQQVFQMPDYQNKGPVKPQLKVESPLEHLKYFQLNIKYTQQAPIQKTQQIQDFLIIKLFPSGQFFNPILQKNPSLLKPDIANLEALPKPLKIMYNYLEKLSLTNLPDYEQKPGDYFKKEDYTGWKYFPVAVQHSLTTPFQKRIDGKPYGILNHLYKMKMGGEYKPLSNINTFQNKNQILDHIYSQRNGYIRLQLLPHEGIGPGSMAVLEVWPPYSCSPIHNHGQAYGLIKVLSGNIRVENFSELTFDDLNSSPYMINDYKKDQYTWISEESFAIHRLVNVYQDVGLSLQAYYHNQYPNEFFSQIRQKDSKKEYIEYYPQNDWQNYLNLAQDEDTNEFDKQFIKNIITTYKLQGPNGVNWQFPNLAMILKDEYDYLKNFSLPKTEFMPKTQAKNLIYWVDDRPQRNMCIIKQFENLGIEVIAMESTNDVSVLFDESLDKIKKLEKKIIFISNMKRIEGRKYNDYAGGDLFKLILKDKKLNCTCIAYVANEKDASFKLKRYQLDQEVQVVRSRDKLVHYVKNEFEIRP